MLKSPRVETIFAPERHILIPLIVLDILMNFKSRKCRAFVKDGLRLTKYLFTARTVTPLESIVAHSNACMHGFIETISRSYEIYLV